MDHTTHTVSLLASLSFLRAAGIGLLMIVTTYVASAQTNTTDRDTASGIATGSSSYALGGFDNINLFNGNLNFKLPLLVVGGRGGAEVSMNLALNTKSWRVKHTLKIMPDGNELHRWSPRFDSWTGGVGYGPGYLSIKPLGITTSSCSGVTKYSLVLTRLSLTTPDGGEHELRDQLSGGQPLFRTSCTQGASRGTVFVSADGSAMTFISDTTILDRVNLSDPSPLTPSGFLMLANGTRYRFDNGLVTWIRDRNGNRLSYTYDASARVSTITDSLGRQVTVNYDVSDISPYGLCDQIVFNGFGGAQRIIRISKTNLGNALRPNSGFSVQTHAQLFPELNAASTTTYFDPTLISQVWMPDNRMYQFYYNSYGELSKVVLPTGGSVEWDMTPGSGVITACQFCDDYQIYRRVVQRRVYVNGTTLEGKSAFSISPAGYPPSQPWTTTVTVDHLTPGETLLSREKHYFNNNAAGSLFQSYQFDVYSEWDEGNEYRTEALAEDGSTVLRRVDKELRQRAPVSWWSSYASTYGLGSTHEPPNDPRVVETITTLVDTNQVCKRTSIDPQTGVVGFDQYNNQTDTWEFAYGAGAPGALLRRSRIDYLTNGYDTNTNVHIRNLPSAVTVYDAAGQQVARNEMLYDESGYPLLTYGTVTGWIDPGNLRGNVTTSRQWLDTSGTYLETHAQYDQVGNVRNAWDAKGNLSQLEYIDSFSDSITRNTFAFPTRLTSTIPDPTNTYATNTPLITTNIYDFSIGHVTTSTDANNRSTTYSYTDDLGVIDPLSRVRKVTRPDGGWTKLEYNQNFAGFYVYTQTLQNTAGTVMHDYQFLDGLGRVYRVFKYENYDPANQWLTGDTQYNALGRVWRTSLSYRSTGSNSAINPSGKWTETAYDALGRAKTVTTRPDNAFSVISYSGNTVTVTDELNKSRRTVTDALGRLVQTIEDPNGLAYVTNYTYDVLGNLRKVDQGGQFRFFMYDSLGRLIRSKEAELGVNPSITGTDPVTGNSQWSMSYAYDPNANLTTRVDALGTTTTYTYDNFNRSTTVNYSSTAANPDLVRAYDGATDGKGRFWYNYAGGPAATATEHTAIDSYDVTGRPLVQRQHFRVSGAWSSAYQFTHAYDLTGAVITTTYPSGRTVTYSYDVVGRIASVSGNLGDGVTRNYSSGIIYDETGGMRQEQFGTDTPIYNKRFYNVRGQLSEIRVSTYGVQTPGQETNWNRGALINHYSNQNWAGSGTDNNNTLKKQDVYIPADDQISSYSLTTFFYDYDALNRLDKVTEVRNSVNSWVQDYDYDRWGNRTINAANSWGGVPEPQFTVDSATNRLGVPSGATGVMSYDANGNLYNDTYTGYGTRNFDAENRVTSAQDVYAQTSTYTYDADGHRVRRRIAGGTEQWEVYGISGSLLCEYSPGASPSTPLKEFAYRNGELIVQATTPTSSGTGLTGRYFDNMDFTNLKLTRDDATVNFDWGVGTPHSSVGADTFTVRWEGKVEPRYSQLYTFYTLTDDGVRLWVNGQLLIDKWIDQGPTEWSGQINLVAGQRYNIVMEFYENGGGALAKLSWSSASQVKEIVPQSQLYPPTTSNVVDFQWLVSDQIGTPRMVLDKTGALSGVKRHDYYPFGEEIFAPQGGRTVQQGYSNDNVKRKFAGYERDDETGLDFAQARYYDSELGRFITPDPLLSSGYPTSPQSWNRYSYVRNQPLSRVDPTGLFEWSEELGGGLTDDQLRQNQCAAKQCTADELKAGKRSQEEVDRIIGERNRVREAIAYLQTLVNSPLLSLAERSRLQTAISAYGAEYENNGVYIMGFNATKEFTTYQMLGMSLVYLGNPTGEHIMDRSLGLLHEGQHIADYKSFMNGGPDLTQFQYEVNGFVTEGIGAKAAMKSQGFYPRNGQLPANEQLWNPSWGAADVDKNRNSGAINRVSANYTDPSGRKLEQTNQGPTMGGRERAVQRGIIMEAFHP
jgi:RHS repeat-associated protein